MKLELDATCSADVMIVGVPATNPIGQLVVKVTYGVRDGRLRPSSRQLPVWPQDAYNGGRLYSKDQQFPKENVDLVVIGDAVAPGEEPAEQVEVSISVGGFNRRLLVIGDRYWRESRKGEGAGAAAPPPVADLTALKALKEAYSSKLPLPPQFTPPEPPEQEDQEQPAEEKEKEYKASRPARFRRMRLEWDRAYGGESGGVPFQDNPAGKGFILAPQKKGEKPVVSGVALPNIENPAQRITSWKSNPGPVCCSFYPQTWGLRMRKGLQMRGAKVPCVLAAMFNQAHPDFELGDFPHGQELTIRGMTPAGEFRCRVEEPAIGARLELAGFPDRPLSLRWDLICVRPEHGEVYMVGRAPFMYSPATQFQQTVRVVPVGAPVHG